MDAINVWSIKLIFELWWRNEGQPWKSWGLIVTMNPNASLHRCDWRLVYLIDNWYIIPQH
jgi:hypothetical protein